MVKLLLLLLFEICRPKHQRIVLFRSFFKGTFCFFFHIHTHTHFVCMAVAVLFFQFVSRTCRSNAHQRQHKIQNHVQSQAAFKWEWNQITSAALKRARFLSTHLLDGWWVFPFLPQHSTHSVRVIEWVSAVLYDDVLAICHLYRDIQIVTKRNHRLEYLYLWCTHKQILYTHARTHAGERMKEDVYQNIITIICLCIRLITYFDAQPKPAAPK